MPQNIAEGIFQLGLVVTGLENLKAMTTAQRQYREETERLKPAEAKTILTIEDLTGPILKAQIRSWEQLAAIITKVGLNAAAAIPQLEAMARAAGMRATSANIGAQGAQFGLYPGDIAAIDEGQRLYGAARRAYVGLERRVRRPTTRLIRGGPLGYWEGGEIQKSINYLGRNGPAMGFPQLAALTSEDVVLDEAEAANLIATIAPQIQAANVVAVMRTGLRSAMASGPFLGMSRRAFGKGTISPAAGQLAAIGPLGAFAEGNFGAKVTERLNRLALALAQMPKGYTFTGEPEPVRMSRLSRALLETSNFFGLPPGATAPYVRDEYTEQAEALEREAAKRHIPARYIPRRVRPRYFGTGIEVTGRFVRAEIEDPLGERNAALARLQGEGLIPPFAIPGQRSGLMTRVRNYLGGWLPSRNWFPFLGGESGMARVGRGTGSITQDAIDFINQYKSTFRTPAGEPALFPKTLGRVLNLPPENVQMLVASLQQQHYLGERTEAGNYPIIPATIRQQRKFQAEMAAKVEKDQIAAMQQDTIETRAKANAAKKAAAAANQETQAEKEAAEAQREAAAALRFSRTGKASTIFPPTAWTTGGGGAGPEPFGLGSNAILNWQGGGGGPPVNMFGMPVPGFGGGGGGGGGGGRPGLFSFGRFASRFAGLTNFVAAAAIIYPIAQTIFSTIGAATQLQTELTRIQAIFGTKNLSDQLTIKQDVLNAARQLGEDVNQVAEAAQAFAQAGTSIANLGSNMQAAATGAKAFGTNIREVADYIIAVGESSRGKVGPNQAVDLLAAIGRRTNVSPLSIMQTIQNVNPLLEPFAPPIGAISNEALLGSIAGVVKQRTGVSNPEMALRFAISQLGNPQAAEKLQRISGIGFGTAESRGQDLRPFIEILGDLSRAYQHLIDTGRSAEAKELLRDFFGARQAVVGTTILQDWTKILKTARDAIGDTGAAANMAGPQVETFSSKFSKLKTTLTGFWGAFLEPAGDVLGFLDDILNHLVNINAQRAAAEQNRDPRSRSLYEMKMAAGETAGPPEPPSLTHFGLSTYDLLRGNLPGATAVPNTFGNIGPAFGMLRKQQNINELFNLEGTTPPQIIDYEQKRLQFEKLQADVTERLRAQTETWKLLGEGESHAKTELKEYSQLIQAYIAIPVYERTSENTKAFEEDMANYRTARAEVIREDLARNAITMERQRRLQDLRFTTAVGRIARKGVEETPEATLQEHINDILDTQRIKREEILFSYRDEIELLRDQAGPLLERDLEIADRKYNLAERGLSLESRQLIMEQQSNFLNEEKTKHLQKQREIQNELNKLTQQSLQGLIKGIEQERATGGKVRFGQLLTSQLLGPAAGYITGQIGANFDLFGEKGIFPGVGKFIQGAFGKAEYPVKPPTLESATREIQAERATQGIMSSGGGLSLAEASARRLAENVAKYKTAKEAFDKKQARDQAIVAAGMFGGQLIGAAEGGSETAINIGSTIGTLAGTPFGPPGMAVGALLGGVIGGLFGHRRPRPEIGHLQIIAENTREQVRLLENTNKLLETNFVSFNVPTGFRLPAYVPGSFGGVGGLRGASGGVVNSQIAVNVNIGGTNVAADKLGQTIAQAISDRLEFESRSSGGYFPRTLYG